MRYSIVFKPSAKREFDKLDRPIKVRIQCELERLSQDPFHPGTKQLKNELQSRRARVGDYRVVYDVVREQVIVLVLGIEHRREVYRSL
jgi:mRNA interferase RelE/StbE